MVEEQLNLVQKLARVRSIADAVAKDKKGFNYTYSDITEILAKVTAGMKKYRISLIPHIEPGTAKVSQNVVVNTKVTKTGDVYDQTTTEMLVQADMAYRWINDDNPEEYIDVPWLVVGSQTDVSQAFGSGLTYCSRYFLTNYFQIGQGKTAKDVDEYRSKQKAAEAAEDRAIAEQIIEQFDILLKEYLADHPDKSEEVKAFISRFAKNANYFTIKEPNLASKLLSSFKDTYLKGE
jgi:hypothetical protein